MRIVRFVRFNTSGVLFGGEKTRTNYFCMHLLERSNASDVCADHQTRHSASVVVDSASYEILYEIHCIHHDDEFILSDNETHHHELG